MCASEKSLISDTDMYQNVCTRQPNGACRGQGAPLVSNTEIYVILLLGSPFIVSDSESECYPIKFNDIGQFSPFFMVLGIVCEHNLVAARSNKNASLSFCVPGT